MNTVLNQLIALRIGSVRARYALVWVARDLRAEQMSAWRNRVLQLENGFSYLKASFLLSSSRIFLCLPFSESISEVVIRPITPSNVASSNLGISSLTFCSSFLCFLFSLCLLVFFLFACFFLCLSCFHCIRSLYFSLFYLSWSAPLPYSMMVLVSPYG